MSPNKQPASTSPLPAVGIAAALLALALIAAVSLASISDLARRAAWVVHTNEVISRIEEVGSLLKDAQSAARGFVITERPGFLRPYDEARRLLPERFAALDTLVADNPVQQRSIIALQTHAREALAFNARLLEIRHTGSADEAKAFVERGGGDGAMQRIREQAASMIGYERSLLAERENRTEVSVRRARAFILLGAMVGGLLSASAFLLVRAENRKRRIADDALLKANASLLQRATELEATNKELESFSYSISHDLRIPLRAVSGYTRMLDEDYGQLLDAEGHRLLDVIRDNSKRMGNLIDDLLTFSRLGRQGLQVDQIDMRGLVDNAITQVRRKGDYPDSQIEIGDLPKAYGDHALLQQVWMNLLSNALKYSGTMAQPCIRINGTRTADETIYAVADNGVGFDMQYYHKLFGVFQRLHSADEFPGTGVGLAISQRIVVKHRGRIWAESALGAGATFFFSIPNQELPHEQ
ncbi:signal transduction histidine kinase [Actimicrobium sp. GrIS 1.19]|uniref:sensor histidine kinase n=1 Tax=Actimicrobium sp. GrIS 1.19 TaxID=3071708 RepID=UPI002DF8FA4C|nr:signal transduction histidine kinase [Actimicrobium sp. GrIS 1.19]